MCVFSNNWSARPFFLFFFLSQSIKGASLTIKDRNASCASYFTLTESVTSHTGVQCVPMVPYVS